jgi:hypothetical protein
VPVHDFAFTGIYCQFFSPGFGFTLISQSPSDDTTGPRDVVRVTPSGFSKLVGPIFQTMPEYPFGLITRTSKVDFD